MDKVLAKTKYIIEDVIATYIILTYWSLLIISSMISMHLHVSFLKAKYRLLVSHVHGLDTFSIKKKFVFQHI